MDIKKTFDITIYETPKFTISQDWEVPIPGFFILSSKRNIKTIDEFNEQETLEFGRLIKEVRSTMRNNLKISKIFLFYGEDTPHAFHVWFLPYESWMKKECGGDIALLKIIKYAKKNMMNEETIKKVKEYAEKAKLILNNQ
jgi:diadenosine tetraphosphate (Ap4A) HIT family hydrolase